MLNPIRPRPLSWMSVLIAPRGEHSFPWVSRATFLGLPFPLLFLLSFFLWVLCNLHAMCRWEMPRSCQVEMFAEHLECGFPRGKRERENPLTVQWETLKTLPHLARALSVSLSAGQDKHVNFEKCKNSIIRFNVLFIASGKATDSHTPHSHPAEQLEF